MTPRFRQLEIFRAVMEAGSVTDAAKLLRVSQPAVSKMLQQAESQLGFQLFVRIRGSLMPTVEARKLLPELIKAFSAMESVNRLAHDLRDAKSGVVTVAASASFGNSLIGRTIERFRATRPRTRVLLQTLLNHEIVEFVAEQKVDVGFALSPAEDSGTAASSFCSTDLFCVMPHDHQLAGFSSIDIQMLQSHPLISFNSGRPIGALLESVFGEAGLRRNLAVEVTQSWTACSLVQAGAGIAIVDGFALLGGMFSDLVKKPLAPRIQITGRMLTPRHRPVSRLAKAFISEFEGVVREHIDSGELSECQPGSNNSTAGGPGLPDVAPATSTTTSRRRPAKFV